MFISPQSAHFYIHLRIIFKITSSCWKVISEKYTFVGILTRILRFLGFFILPYSLKCFLFLLYIFTLVFTLLSLVSQFLLGFLFYLLFFLDLCVCECLPVWVLFWFFRKKSCVVNAVKCNTKCVCPKVK